MIAKTKLQWETIENYILAQIHTNSNCTLCHKNDKDTWLHLLSLMWKQVSQRTQNCETQRRCPPTTPTYSNHANTQGSSHSPSLTHKVTNDKKTLVYLGYSNVCASPQMSIPSQTPPNYYIKGATYKHLVPLFLTPDLSIQIIKFTFTHNRYIHQALEMKHNKYYPLINVIQTQG